MCNLLRRRCASHAGQTKTYSVQTTVIISIGLDSRTPGGKNHQSLWLPFIDLQENLKDVPYPEEFTFGIWLSFVVKAQSFDINQRGILVLVCPKYA